MSDDWMNLIPEDPSLIIPLERLDAVRSVAANLAPEADDVTISSSGRMVFVDAGGNFESIHCPSCGRTLDHEWWSSAMRTAHDVEFEDLRVQVPCCGAETTLHELDYDWPQGFGRSQVSIFNPGRGQLTQTELAELERAAGADLRVIWQHI